MKKLSFGKFGKTAKGNDKQVDPKVIKGVASIEEKKELSDEETRKIEAVIATHSADGKDESEFESFFGDVLKRFPTKTTDIILSTYGKTKGMAEKVLAKSKTQFDAVFDEFLVGVDEETRKKSHQTIHAAALSAAIIGCSPIPFSDAVLLVPVQLTMMSRLHRIFGKSWSESLGKSLSRELIVVGFGKSAVGNVMKLIPGVGTVAGATVNATVASAITECLGWVTVKMLNDGVDIFDQVMSFKGQFKLLFNALQGSHHSKK